MPRRQDLKKILIIGSGPIVIGQACEFDYSGTQACKALMAEGFEVILVNSNPATIMTDPELASKVYIEPLQPNYIERILEKERPDAIIPTLGGQTALNLALKLDQLGILEKYKVELLGANPEVINKAEDREKFIAVLDSVGARYPKSHLAKSFEDGLRAGEEIGLPIILRPNFTLGGGGGGVAYTMEEFKTKLAVALHESPTTEVLIEESILGWKEFELEIMRDRAGTFVVICTIENLDPCGIHTGDSITVAPIQTLSDRAYQDMRDEAQKIVNAVGVETGGANIQFAVNPETDERVVIEMNPRVSRSSALASKATGFPIAKIAALLAVGYQLEEITNDITKTTPSCYEPSLDYVVTKIPRFAFEKFTGVKDVLTTQMKSVGEVMAIGRTFKESLQKALQALEGNEEGIPDVPYDAKVLSSPNSNRIYQVFQAFREGKELSKIAKSTMITPWFLEQIQNIVDYESVIAGGLSDEVLLSAKRLGFSDARIARLTDQKPLDIRKLRHRLNLHPAYYQVDTCAGEFASSTPYYYSTYWGTQQQRENYKSEELVLLGSGPNRIGQGVEFDYSCVRSVRQFQKEGYRMIMVNSNPETVSTDYDTSDELFFEPLDFEHIDEILNFVKPKAFISQLGGQTPINLAPKLVEQGYQMLGSSLEAMDLAEDRGQFIKLCNQLGFKIPKSVMVGSLQSALEIAKDIGYPIICRPSYVLGGRRMEIVETQSELKSYFQRHADFISEESPCLMDQFLERALEVDVDLARGKDWTVIGGVIEHIEAAGVHSGDSMGVLPPQRLKEGTCEKIEELSEKLAEALGVLGFLNLQLAVKDDEVYMIEANPRSSRSVPFIAKSTGVPIVGLGVKAMLGQTSDQVRPERFNWKQMSGVTVKGVVFPFKKLPEADSILGPEMKSTGESMGRGAEFSEALMKAFVSSHMMLPAQGEVFFSLRDKDKQRLLPLAKRFSELGYSLSATGGTARFLEENGLKVEHVKKVLEGRPHCVDRIRSGQVDLVINTTSGRQSIEASFSIRRSCIDFSVPCLTESDAALGFMVAVEKQSRGDFEVLPLHANTEI